MQDHENPSAKDHSNQPAHPAPLGEGPAAPHQGASLRQAQEDRAAEQDYLVEQWGSGRSSHEGSELLDEETDFLTDSSTLAVDENSMHQNGSMARSSEDSDMTDADDENGVDDDMVDKISSSPSIDDGAFIGPTLPLKRHVYSQFAVAARHYSSSDYIQEAGNNSDFTTTPKARRDKKTYEDNLTRKGSMGKVAAARMLDSMKSRKRRLSSAIEVDSERLQQRPIVKSRSIESMLRRKMQKHFQESKSDTQLSLPSRREKIDEDDDLDSCSTNKSRYVMKGWLLTTSLHILTEDIDFEFVYALHTFVATVEGQANATKGDTMQLLDDSNSYWWLVRVCKDSSIGRFSVVSAIKGEYSDLFQDTFPRNTSKRLQKD